MTFLSSLEKFLFRTNNLTSKAPFFEEKSSSEKNKTMGSTEMQSKFANYTAAKINICSAYIPKLINEDPSISR